MQVTKTIPASRLPFLDWTRGLAALIMLQGHVFNSFTKTELRDSGPYVLSQFLGGIPASIFLFLLGLTLSFRMDAGERKGLGPARRVLSGLFRARYLLLVAILFRLQLWIFGLPYSSWRDLFRVDILNSMALAAAVLSVMGLFTTIERARLCAVLGAAIAIASPFISQIDWSHVHPFVSAYILPDYLFFGFFPHAAFVAFGMSAGSILRLLRAEQLERVIMWGSVVGFGLVLGGQYFAGLPFSVYPKSEFWLNSPALTFIKLGVILLILAFAFLWTQYAAGRGWSLMRQFGTTSLLIYWVHVELVYGRWLWFWKENLTTNQTAVAAVGVILLMLAVSVARTNWDRWKNLQFAPGGYFFGTPRRASGD
jgi:peptidoglycan/LPS O-acetylase OafA/YrhL